MVSLSTFDILPEYDIQAVLPELLDKLPPWRLEKALAYRFELDRFLCAKSFLMLEEMLADSYGIAPCPAFSYDAHGKPYFAEYPDIHFNISHCHQGVACALADRPVGVDIEEIRYHGQVAEKVLNSNELEQVNSAADPAEKFAEFWTRKESFVKLIGKGLTVPLKDILAAAEKVVFDTRINRQVGYVCTLAKEAE